MPPPPRPNKRIKRPPKVLDEDTYTETLSHIIARDFFPGLLEAQIQQEFLDAVDAKDGEWITEAGRKLTQVMTPGPDGRRMRGRRGTSMTPVPGVAGDTPRSWAGDTPASVAGSEMSGTTSRTGREKDNYANMSLTRFQATYTSEDNESFNALLDKQNAKKAEKYAWMWSGNKIPSGRQIAFREREQKLLAASKESADAKGSRNSRTELALVKKGPDSDSRKAMPDTCLAAPRNSFMFLPDSIEDTHETVAEAAAAASNAPPKTVIYDNTRLPPPAEGRPLDMELHTLDDAEPVDAQRAESETHSGGEAGFDASACSQSASPSDDTSLHMKNELSVEANIKLDSISAVPSAMQLATPSSNGNCGREDGLDELDHQADRNRLRELPELVTNGL